VRRDTLGDALDHHLASTVTAVEDRDARARGKGLEDQPVRKRNTEAVAKDDVVRMLFFENANHDARHHWPNVRLVPGDGLLDSSPKERR